MALVHCMSFDSSTAIADFASEFTIMQGLSIGTAGPSGANYLTSGATFASYSTWRVLFHNVPASNVVSIAELVMASVAGGATLCSGGTAAASGSVGGFVAANAFDGNPSTFWASALSPPTDQWLQYTFAAAVSVAEVRIAVRNDNNPSQSPGPFDVQGSNDGVTFTTVQSYAASVWSNGQVQTFAITASAAATNWNMRQAFNPFAAAAQGFIGVRIQPSATAACLFGVTDSASNPQFFVQIGTNGQPILYQATGTAAAFGFGTAFYTGTAGQIPLGVFSYMEIGFVVSATVGTLTLRINGSVVFTVSGVNTRGTSAGPEVAAYLLYGYASILDVIVADATGLAPSNTFFGDVRVYEVVPNGPGSVTQFTPTGAATDWQAAAVSPPTPATVYNSASAVNLSDRYAHAVIPPALNVVYGVRVKARAQKTSAAARSISLNINSGASTAAGTPHPLSLTPVVYADVFTVDPATGLGFTPAGVNALQFGPTVIV